MESETSNSTSSAPTSAHPTVVEPSAADESLASASDEHHPSDASASASDEDSPDSDSQRLQRPGIGSRKSSGTIIIPRESKNVELEDEEYDENDARTMSPRRTSEEIERMGEDARQALINQAKHLQASLLEVVERVETVKNEHEKLEGGNRFLQS